MIAIRLYQNRTKTKADGKAPIYFVLASGRERKYISAKRYLLPEHFDNATGQVLRGADNYVKLNAYFKREMTRLDDIIIDLKNDGHEPTFEKVEEKYRNNHSDNFITFAEAELKEQAGLIKKKTLVGYAGRIRNLKGYKPVLPFHAINHSFLTTYKLYLITVKKRRANGYYQDFAAIKKLYKIAVAKGLAKGNPFEHFKLNREETNRNWNSQEELIRLKSLLSGNEITESQKNTLRHYLFSCFTGLRFGDKVQFNNSHIVDDRIQLKTSKTGKHVLIPFNNQARELLPFILGRSLKRKNRRVNDDLEICMEKAKVAKHITYHCSRHSFAINCLLSGIDIITVRDWLGHKSVTTTEIYAKIATQYKDESMKKFDSFFDETEGAKKNARNGSRKSVTSARPQSMKASKLSV